MLDRIPEGFSAVISSAVGGAVWDLVWREDRCPVLVAHVSDVGKWWATVKPSFDRVFETESRDSLGLPTYAVSKPGMCSESVRLVVMITEPPVSFGMAVLWAGWSPDERKKLGAIVQERTKGGFRFSTGGGLYRIAGRKNIPQEFMTPWAAVRFLVELLHGDVKNETGIAVPRVMRGFCPW